MQTSQPTHVQQAILEDDEVSYAFFLLAGREFGIEVQYVRETISGGAPLTQMPNSMDIMDGLINLRGSIIPIINLRTRFQIESRPPKDDDRIVITHFNGYLFGLRFDEISEVIRIKQHHIKSVSTSQEDPELCSHGIVSLEDGARIVQLLDLELLFKKYNLPQVSNNLDESRTVYHPRKQDITFVLDGQEYAIDVHAIHEIIKPPEINRKILVDPAIRGVIDLRGEIINIIDLRVYFNLDPLDISAESRIIILQGSQQSGILVDSVNEVIHYEEDQILEIQMIKSGSQGFSGIVALEGGRNIIKLDTDNLFDASLLKQLHGNIDLHTDQVQTADGDTSTNNVNSDLDDRVLISFQLEDDYAFDIGLFREIINYNENIVGLPGAKAYHEGILNLRNSAIPIINLRKYYGMEEFVDIKDSKIIILNLEGKTIGIMVDRIIEIVKPARMKVDRLPNLTAERRGHSCGHHVREAYRFQNLGEEENILLIYDVEGLMRDIELSVNDKKESA